MSFVADESIQQEALAECIKLSDYVLETFQCRLDWTDMSIEKVEELLGLLHREAQKDGPTDAQVFAFAKGFGSYIGEVYRRNHGAQWGIVTLGGQDFPGLSATGSGVEFWPWGRAQQRIVDGPSNNVWHYYQTLLAKRALVPTTERNCRPVSWWRRMFRRP